MKKERKSGSISTFLGGDAKVEGSIEFQGTIRVDGKVTGKISSNGGTVIVGEKAVLHADISVAAAVVMGEVDGTIEATERIEVYPPGCVSGEIQAPVISIEPGGMLNGRCTMKTAATSSSKPGTKPKIHSVAVDSKEK